MAIVCWGNLAKSATDTQRIEQAILGYVETHDENPNAHMGPDYALGAHRLQVVLDHLPYSVLNKYLYPQSRTYKAIVDPAGYGDVLTIQGAIDYVNGLGGGAILIKAGTYSLSANLVIYSNIELVGEDDDLVTIQFSSTSYNVQIKGTSGTHKRNVNISRINFKGFDTLDAYKLFDIDYLDDSSFSRCKVTMSPTYEQFTFDFYINHSNRLVIDNNRFITTVQPIYIVNSNQVDISNNYIDTCNTQAIQIETSNNIKIENNYFSTITSYGIYSASANKGLVISDNLSIDNGDMFLYLTSSSNAIIVNNTVYKVSSGGYGFYLESCTYSTIIGNIIIDGTGNGIEFVSTDRSIIEGNVVKGCSAWGIKINGATNDKDIVLGNVVYSNASGAISDTGTGTIVEHNIIT